MASALALTLVLLASAVPSFALSVPSAPTGRVSDFAGALSPPARDRLERQLQSYEQGTTQQIAVALFHSLEGESLEDFSIHLAEKWKIGGKGSDNGVLVVLFLDDHKLRIEVGYGLEDKLTDARAAQIIRDVMAPRLRDGDLEGALRMGLATIDATTTGRAHDAELPRGRRAAPAPPLSMFLFFGLFVLLFVLRLRRFGRGGGGFWIGGSGGWSGGGGSFGGGGGFSGGGGSFGGGGSSGSW